MRPKHRENDLQPVEESSVAIRKPAKQRRSKEKVQRILDTTLTMLNGTRADKITTNDIAKAAGVNIATLYQFFPKKEAIFYELYRHWLEQTLALLDAVDARFDGSEGMEAYADAVFECLSGDASINSPGHWQLRFALGNSTELAELEAQHEQKAFLRIIAAQEKFSRKVTQDEAHALARLQHHVSVACLYAAAEVGSRPERDILLEWCKKTMHLVYDVEKLKDTRTD
ncbi:MAG: TetR/AcrR family transcriptional regulator [Pseudomonadota bacterium]